MKPISESLSIYMIISLACGKGTYVLPLDAAYVADVAHVLLHLVVLLSEGTEGIDNDTEYDVEERDDDHHEEYHVMCHTNVVCQLGVIEVRIWRHEITYTTSSPKTVVNDRHVAVQHTVASGVSFLSRAELNVIIIHVVVEKGEVDNCVDPHEDEL
jgi:hypothetical protein